MSILNAKIARLDGTPATLGDITGGPPRPAGQRREPLRPHAAVHRARGAPAHYADRGFTVVGVPCNQFGGQEPGSAEEIAEFCSATYGVTFPMTEKVDVNGDDRHEIFAELADAPNEKGEAGDVNWNFEKFLLAADGAVVARFRPQVEPDSPRLVAAIEGALGVA